MTDLWGYGVTAAVVPGSAIFRGIDLTHLPTHLTDRLHRVIDGATDPRLHQDVLVHLGDDHAGWWTDDPDNAKRYAGGYNDENGLRAVLGADWDGSGQDTDYTEDEIGEDDIPLQDGPHPHTVWVSRPGSDWVNISKGVPGPGERTAMPAAYDPYAPITPDDPFQDDYVPAEFNEHGHIRVHRGIRIPKGAPVPKNNLGAHWSLNDMTAEYFGTPYEHYDEEESDNYRGVVYSGWYDWINHPPNTDNDKLDANHYHEQELTLHSNTPVHVDQVRYLRPDSPDWEPLYYWKPGHVTAARTAMPAYYHYTEDPDFEPDNWSYPNKYDPETPEGPGIFVAPEEHGEDWSDYGPYRAEFHSPHDLANHPDVWTPKLPSGERFPMEMFVPGHLFNQWEYKGLQKMPRTKKARTMTAAVTVYTKPSCPQCDMTKKLLDRLGVEHSTVDVTADPEAHAYVTGLGYQQAPVVVVGDGEDHWGGFKVDRLKGLAQ